MKRTTFRQRQVELRLSDRRPSVDFKAELVLRLDPMEDPGPSSEISFPDSIPDEYQDDLWNQSMCNGVILAITDAKYPLGEWCVKVSFPVWQISEPYDRLENGEISELGSYFAKIAYDLAFDALDELRPD